MSLFFCTVLMRRVMMPESWMMKLAGSSKRRKMSWSEEKALRRAVGS